MAPAMDDVVNGDGGAGVCLDSLCNPSCSITAELEEL